DLGLSDLGLSGKSIMITAGPTWEALDPVRGITNHSSGMMGYALANAAVEAGARVTLVTGPTHIAKPDRVKVIDVVSALEMHQAVMDSISKQDIFIGVAAVADYRPIISADQKIKKNDPVMTIEMVKNPDILADVANLEKPPFCVGFAAETNDMIEYAKGKLERKKLQLIAANHVGGTETGFATPDNAITLIGPNSVTELPRASKSVLGRALIREIAKHFLSSHWSA
ncbi:MAG: phosphopantothenoylcysteine decarboxylase/phosphopantothenate--cysteine ligase, partial [Arenicella sp.]